ncbi:MAG: type II secretion system protein N [Gammaproteobacteria bacterium]|nr:type II secretion system protein N [Gammaproteobacteria bacterium]
MFRAWKYLLFFVLCLAIALVINLPIRQLLPHFQLPNTVTLSGVDGSVVSGRARQITINRFPLRDVSYRFAPSCIALLKICYQIDYAQGTALTAYDLLNGDVEVSESRAEYAASELAAYMPDMMVQPGGRLELLIDELTVIAGQPAALNGKLIWRDLGLQADDDSLKLGDYQVEFSGSPQKYDLKLSDLEASLKAAGKGFITADGQYSVDIKLSSDTPIDSKIRNVLDLFATKVSYNNYRLEKKGRLPPNVTRQLF